MPNLETKKPSLSVKILKFFIDAVWYLSWFAAALTAIIVTSMSFGFKPEALQVTVPVAIRYIDEDARAEIPMEERPVIVELTGNAKVLVDPNNKVHRIFVVTVLPLFIAGLLWGVHQLRCFFKTVKEGQPFHPENPGRLRNLAILLIAFGPAYDITIYLQGWLLSDEYKFFAENTELYNGIGGQSIIAGLILFVIAQIFDIGVKLQKEQDLTI